MAKRKYKFEFNYHLTAVDRKLLKAVADDYDAVKVGYNYGFSKRKRVSVLEKGDGFMKVKIVNKEKDPYFGRTSDRNQFVTITW